MKSTSVKILNRDVTIEWFNKPGYITIDIRGQIPTHWTPEEIDKLIKTLAIAKEQTRIGTGWTEIETELLKIFPNDDEAMKICEKACRGEGYFSQFATHLVESWENFQNWMKITVTSKHALHDFVNKYRGKDITQLGELKGLPDEISIEGKIK